MRIRKVKNLGLAVFIGSVVLSGCGASNIAFKQYDDVIDFETRVSAEGETSQEITLKGVSEPFQEVMVSSSVPGFIKEVLVELGSYVDKDQQLAILDDSDLNYQIEQARTLLSLNKAEAEVAAMEQQISLNEMKVNLSVDVTPDIKAQKDTITDLKRDLEIAKQKLKQHQASLNSKTALSTKEIEKINNRIKEIDETNNRNNEIKGVKNRINTIGLDPTDQDLVKEKEQLEKKLVELESKGKITYLIEQELAKEKKLLEASLNNQAEINSINIKIQETNQEIVMIERNLARANEMLDTRLNQQSKQNKVLNETSGLQAKSNDIATSRTLFEMQKAETEINLLEYQLNYLSILAPTNGYITGHNAIVGGTAAANGSMFSITNIDKLYININVPEAFVNKIKQDQEVTVTFPTIGKTVKGKITFISVMGNPNNQTFPVMVLIDNKNHEIKGGMAAQVNIVSKGK
jgi:multidrug efflux pump subunit AcrA (membrane-fusion protein)